MATKIKQPKISKTEEQNNREWGEILSHRNKLLLNSDWTQLPDSGLTPECIQAWKEWRAQVRFLQRRNFSDKQLVRDCINKLTKRQPLNDYAEIGDYGPLFGNPVIPFEEKKRAMSLFLSGSLSKKREYDIAVDKIIGSQSILTDAALYALADRLMIEEHPLMSYYAEQNGVSIREQAATVLMRRVSSEKEIVSRLKGYHDFYDRIERSTTDDELLAIEKEIRQWILT